MIKMLKKEFSEIKMLSTSNVIKQTAFILGVTIVSAACFEGIDMCIQKLVSFII